MSTTEQYATSASRATSAVENLTDFWAQAVRTMSGQMLPALPSVDLVPAVQRYFQLVQRTVDMSRDLTITWVEAGNLMSEAAREQAEAIGGLAREQSQAARDLVHEQADQAEQATRKQTETAARAGQELAREIRETAARAERDQARRPTRQPNDKA